MSLSYDKFRTKYDKFKLIRTSWSVFLRELTLTFKNKKQFSICLLATKEIREIQNGFKHKGKGISNYKR